MTLKNCPFCGRSPELGDRHELYEEGELSEDAKAHRWRYWCYYEGEVLSIIRHAVSTCWEASLEEAEAEWNRFCEETSYRASEQKTAPHRRHG